MNQLYSIISQGFLRSTLYKYKMAEQLQCEIHGSPVTKIERQSLRLLCEQCLEETAQQRKVRIEALRIKLNKIYEKDMEDLKDLKGKANRLIDLFLNNSMLEGKRMINKALPEMQTLVNGILERQLTIANNSMRACIDEEMRNWSTINGEFFNGTYMKFENESLELQNRIKKIKQENKKNIATILKEQLHQFYSRLFNF